MSKPRFVFDTNVVISALLLPRSLARQALDRALAVGELLVSPATVAELSRVLQRKSFAKYVTEEERIEFLRALVNESVMIEVETQIVACRDPKDDMFLSLAVSGRAVCIVSGDEDLLVLHPFQGVAIVTPRDFLAYSID
ncbi:MAG: putative toxin-antitoxin system toxin component, PIN family [Candidatus Caldarchaeum sp.]